MKIALLAESFSPGGAKKRSPKTLDQQVSQAVRRSAQLEVAGRIRRTLFGSEHFAALADDPLAADDQQIPLQVVNLLDSLDERVLINRAFRDEDDVRLP